MDCTDRRLNLRRGSIPVAFAPRGVIQVPHLEPTRLALVVMRVALKAIQHTYARVDGIPVPVTQ